MKQVEYGFCLLERSDRLLLSDCKHSETCSLQSLNGRNASRIANGQGFGAANQLNPNEAPVASAFGDVDTPRQKPSLGAFSLFECARAQALLEIKAGSRLLVPSVGVKLYVVSLCICGCVCVCVEFVRCSPP